MERRPLTTQRTTTPARAGPGLGPPIRSHEMQHSALLVGLVSDSPGYELPCAEDNSLATAMLPLHRTKKSENRALNSASNIKDYIANGGSVSGLKAEVALGNVILDEANTDILTRGSYLWVIVVPRYLRYRVPRYHTGRYLRYHGTVGTVGTSKYRSKGTPSTRGVTNAGLAMVAT